MAAPYAKRVSSGTRKFSFGRRCGRFERRSMSFTPIWKACLPTREAIRKAARTDILSRFRSLIDGIEKGGENGERKRKRYLRSLPVNPFAAPGAPLDAQWTFVSSQSEAPVVATSSYGTTLAEARRSRKDIYDLVPKRPQWPLTGRGGIYATAIEDSGAVPASASRPLQPSRKRGSPGSLSWKWSSCWRLSASCLHRGAARDNRADESPGGDASARPQDHAQAHRRLLRRQGRVPALAPGAFQAKGYLRAIPRDPVNGNKAEWKTVLAKEGGVSDVRSLSNERGAPNGTPYTDW